MVRSVIRTAVPLAAILVGLTAPASAQVVQSFQVNGGGFFPRGFDGRPSDDVLVENLSVAEPLLFDIDDFRGFTVNAEWGVGVSRRLEFAAGVGYYRSTVPSVYRNLVDVSGREIEQDLRLRIVPISGVVRLMPFGRASEIQPYIGAGVSALNYRYSEAGEFVDLTDFSTFPARFVASGTAPGGLFLAGVRFPIGGDIYGLTTEYRYQWGTGETGGADEGFLADKIDLSGGNFTFGFLMRF
jgi:hypothetical protein